jgi:hypothetical protein
MEIFMDPNSRPGSAMLLRKYAVNHLGTINFIESFLEPGRFLAQRLDYKGTPVDSKVVTVRELAGMRLFSNLREARGYGATRARLAEQLGRGGNQ